MEMKIHNHISKLIVYKGLNKIFYKHILNFFRWNFGYNYLLQ